MSVLRFFRGIDISGTSFEDEAFPDEIDNLLNIRWIKLDSCDLDVLPSAVNRLSRLEYVSICKNKVLSVGPSVSLLSNLRTFRASQNDLAPQDIDAKLYQLEDLTTLDLAQNSFDSIPDEMANATNLIVLDLSTNQIGHGAMSSKFLAAVTDLDYLDLSHNNITSLPVKFRRLYQLKVLILSHNPFDCKHSAISAVGTFENLTRLELRATNRDDTGLPVGLAECQCLEEIDLAENAFTVFPEVLLLIPSLTHINLGDNGITELPSNLGDIEDLHTLIISRNNINDISPICGVSKIKSLYASSNDINAIPQGIGNLKHLTKLHLQRNQIQAIPIELTTLPELSTLLLDENKIVALPVQLHNLPALKIGTHGQFSVANNVSGLTLPPRELLEFTAATDTATDLMPSHSSGVSTSNRPAGSHKPDDSVNALYGINFEELQQTPLSSMLASRRERSVGVVLGSDDDATAASEALTRSQGQGEQQPGKLRAQTAEQERNAQSILAALKTQSGETAADGIHAHQSHAANRPELMDSFLHSDEDGVAVGEHNVAGHGADSTTNQADAANGIVVPQAAVSREVRKRGMIPARDNLEELFGCDYHDFLGTRVWRIEDFLPVQQEAFDHGNFYQNDCYIVLNADLDENDNPVLRVFYWIGSTSTLDKQASVALTSVYLRSYLAIPSICEREEEGDESKEFLLIFGNKVTYIQGGTESGFFSTEESLRPTRMFLLTHQLRAHAVPLQKKQLQPHGTYLIDEDEEKTIWLWIGHKTRMVQRQRAKFFAQKAAKVHKADVVIVNQGDETEDFLGVFDEDDTSTIAQHDQSVKAEQETMPVIKLHDLHLGDGFVELPQCVPAGFPLHRNMLSTKGVFLVDQGFDLYIWIGRKSSRLLRAAAARIAVELKNMLPRPEQFHLITVWEGNEPQFFKCKFDGWDDVLSTDYRAKDIVQTESALMQKIKAHLPADASLSVQEFHSPLLAALKQTALSAMKVDVAALFSPQPAPMLEVKAAQIEGAWRDDLETSKGFLMTSSKVPVPLDAERVGHFFSKECYIYLCTKWTLVPGTENADADSDDEDAGPQETLDCVAFIWQGREVSNVAWAKFKFGGALENIRAVVRKQYRCELRVVRERQHQESLQFLSLFNRDVVYHRGSYNDFLKRTTPSLYRLHGWHPTIFTKTVEEDVDANLFNVEDAFILRVPFDDGDGGVVYSWCGPNTTDAQRDIASDVAAHNIWGKKDSFSRQVIEPGCEPRHFFLSALNVTGKSLPLFEDDAENRPADRDGDDGSSARAADAHRHAIGSARVFLCSAGSGIFTIRDTSDWYSQDDLDDGGVALIVLPQGPTYMWIGPFASDVVLKLSYASLQQYMKTQPAAFNRQVIEVCKGAEPLGLRKLFHGWSKHLTGAKELAMPFDFLGQVVGTDYRKIYEYDPTKRRPSTPDA